MLDSLLDALLDSLKVLPVLIIVYILIEVIEAKSSKSIKGDKHLSGSIAPVFASLLGIVPQCGFSVIATDLFSKRKIAMGTLIAVFIATSDEGIPLLLSDHNFFVPMLILIGIKFVYATLVGFVINAIYKRIIAKKRLNDYHISNANKTFFEFDAQIDMRKVDSNMNFTNYETPVIVSFDDINKPHVCDVGCCGHGIEKDPKTLKTFIYHPLIHSLKVFSFILIFNVLFGLLLYFVGEETITNFMANTSIFQPLLVGLVGLIPNCVASVAITDLYMLGGITFGSCVAGLCCNAGIALAVLLKQNPSKIENISIISSLYILSVALGFVVDLIGGLL